LVANIVQRDHGDGREHDGKADDAAHRAHAFARHDGADLRGQAFAQPELEAAEPQPQIIAVAAEHVVPRRVALRGDAVVHPLIFQIGDRDRLLQHPLHQQQHRERADIGERQADVDLGTEHDGVEDEAEEQLQREFQLVHDVEEALEGLAGEKRLDLLARRLVAEQLDLAAVLPREAQHEFAEAAIAGALGKHPANDADHI